MTITIMQHNLNRNPRAMDEMYIKAKENNVDIVLIQEQMLNSDGTIKKVRRDTRYYQNATVLSRSAVLFLKPTIRNSFLKDLSNDDIITTEIQMNDGRLILSSIYLPSNTDIHHHLDLMTTIATAHNHDFVIFSGDTNCRHSMWEDLYTSRGQLLVDFILDNDLVLFHSNKSTYQHNDGRSSNIDLTITNRRAAQLITSWKSLPFNIFSDHTPQVFSFNIQMRDTSDRARFTTRIYNETGADWDEYRKMFKPHQLGLLSDDTDQCETEREIDDIVSRLTDVFKQAADSSLPKKRKPSSRHTNSNTPYWWTQELSMLYKCTRRMKNRLHRTKSTIVKQILYIRYKDLKTTLDQSIRKAENESWYHYISDGDKEEAQTYGNAYRFIKFRVKGPTPVSTILEGNLSTVRQRSKELLECFFPSTDEPTTDFLDQGSDYELNESLENVMDFVMTNTTKLNGKKTPGEDGITNNMIKYAPNEAKECLKQLFRTCLERGYFPRQWKTSVVLVLPKPNREDYNLTSSYRPISLTSHLSKLLERIVNTDLMDYLEANDLLDVAQHGFRRGRSTISALSQIMSTVKHSRQKFRAIISFDFKAAFDNVKHETIMSQLRRMNAPELTRRIISSYLNDRTMKLKTNDMTIEHRPHGKGCPQGGVLSPTLWLIVVNDLLSELRKDGFQCVAYADDLTVLCMTRNEQELFSQIEKLVSKVRSWSSTTGIPLNTDKSNILPIGRKELSRTDVDSIAIVREAKILGLTFVRSLRFDLHVSRKISSSYKYLDVLLRNFKSNRGINARIKRTLYNSFAKPSLLYAVEIWGDKINAVTRRKLNTFDNAVLRNAIGGFKSTPVNAIHALTRTPKIMTIIQERASTYNRAQEPGQTREDCRKEMKQRIERQMMADTAECREKVRSVADHPDFSLEKMDQPTTALITNHGPTRAYLAGRRVRNDGDCPSCDVPEDYDHVITECTRFRQIRDRFEVHDGQSPCQAVRYLLEKGHLRDFAQEIFTQLRRLN